MSSSSDEDDLPDLESVDSSEYYSEDDDSDLASDLEEADSGRKKPGSGIDKTSSFYTVAKKWLELDRSNIEKQLLVISVHLFSPFLFGHAHQSDRWLKWCHEVGLLVHDFDFNKDCLTAIELTAVDVLDKAMEHCRNCMMDRESPESLFMLLQLADEIKHFDSAEAAVEKARRRDWFKCMLDVYASDKDIGPISNRQLGKNNFLEIGCLYAINQTAEHVQKFIDGKDLSLEFDDDVAKHAKDGELMKKQGDELFMAGKSEEAIDVYTTAIYCCPYFYDLYLKRAYVFLELQKFQDAHSDSVRATHLRPTHQEGYIRYIQCLSASDDGRRLPVAQRKYSSLFPGIKPKEQLRVALDSSPAFQRRKIDAGEEDRSQYEKLTGLCRQASEAYLNGNVNNAILYYEESIRISSQEKGWQHCMVLSESQRFVISLHFAYGLAQLKKGSGEATEAAIDQFTIIVKEYESIAFPPAFYGLGKALVRLHRHSEALDKAKEGLSLLPNYHLPVSLTWPGTTEVIQETLSHNTEMLLQRLQQQCEPVTIPDAVCRYGNCLQYYSSTDIHLKAVDYKGHVTLHCTDSCSTSYHASCWRRYKSDGVVGADKDYLECDCPTPDCPGTIDLVSVYDNRGKIKIKYESEAPIKKAPPIVSSSSSSSLKESRRSGRNKQLRKKKPIGSVSDAPPTTDVAKETEPKPDKPEKLEKEASVEDQEVLSQEEVPVAMTMSEVSEDSRKTEDSLAVINRQAEVGEVKEKEVGGAKTKTKKKKPKTITSAMTQQWTELFTLPDRHCESAETAAMESETKKPSWPQDPSHPFLPPEHLREAVDHFEKTEVPRLGLRPAPVTASTSDEGPMMSSHETLADVDFVFSYFAEILKDCGPLRATDSRLTDALLLLPDEKRHFISQSGGLEKYLLTSFMFVSHGDLICLAEDAPAVKDSISQSSSSSSGGSSSLGIDSAGERGRARSSSDAANQVSAKTSGRSRHTPGLSSDKQSLNSLVDSHQDGFSGGGGNSLRFENDTKLNTKTYGVELGSGLNSPVDSPRLLSPTDHVNVTGGGSGGGSGSSVGSQTGSSGGGVGGGGSSSSVNSQGGGSGGGISGGGSSSSVGSQGGGSGGDVVGGSKTQKLGTTAPGGSKRPSSAGETRDSADVVARAEKNVTSTTTKAIGHERRQKMKEKSEPRGGKTKRTEKPPERLLSTASSDGGMGILGDFFEHATKESSGLPRSGGSSVSRGGSQGEQDVPSSSVPASALANSKLFRAAMSGTNGGVGGGGGGGGTKSTGVRRDVAIQTGPMWTGVKFVQTDPLPVVDNFKERYDKVLREKKDLQVKLERSEDQKFKMQRDHRREVEKLEKKYYSEAKKESEEKIKLLEERVIEERQKGQSSKKDQADLIRSHKAEIKSLLEKVEKMKKEVSKKDLQIDTNMVQYHSEIEHLRSEKRRYDDRIRSEVEKSQKALRRAVDAEIEVLNMRRELVARPCEQRLKEADTICGNIPPASEFHRDWIAFRDKLKTSFDCFQNAMDDQIQQVKSGRELANLDRVPNPNLVVPPQLRVPMPMMRPRFVPMMPVRGGPMPAVPGGLMVDPGAFGGPGPRGVPVPMPVGGLMPSAEGGVNPPTSSEGGGNYSPVNEVEDPPQPPSSRRGGGGDVGKEQAKGGGAVGGATVGGGGGRKKSSFERIVEKLAPLYPHYAREDFKTFLHEVRRNNHNTLSGLSLDSITDQVKSIIESYEKGRGPSSAHGGGKGANGGNNGKGGAGKGRQNKSKAASRQQQQPPSRSRSRPQQPVATAEPPLMSSIDYDEDGSCIICYEDMIDFDSSRLNCGHRFHTDCIKSWFKEQSTCPTCRNHSLLPEEYPFLK